MIRDAELERKFRKLPNPMSPRNDKLVHNLSSKELTKDQMQVLRHEASFNTAGAKPVNMIATVESVLCQTEATEETKSLTPHQVSSLLMTRRPREMLSKVERDALRELKADKDLVIVPADKGQERVHKVGAPLRLIVSLKGTPTCGLAKRIFQRLKFLTAESNTTVSLSANFLEKLKGLSLHPNEVMVSFDVTSLFTSISYDLAIETIELLLQRKYDETANRLGHAQILQLRKLCRRTYFTFDVTIYEQVKGTPMGSAISGGPATVRVAGLPTPQTEVLDPVLTFQEHMNVVLPDIRFTMEEEEDNQLAFLDVLVCRNDCGGLKSKVFRKAKNMMKLLNFNINHPISHKRSFARTLYRHVETHCSEPEDKIAELQYLRRVFKFNGGQTTVNRVEARAEETSKSGRSTSLRRPLREAQCVTIHDASESTSDEMRGKNYTNAPVPTFLPVHFDEAKVPAVGVQAAENRGTPNKNHCIITQGLPESPANSPKERVAADSKHFQKLLNEMQRPSEDITVINMFRFGSCINAASQTRP
ncbi:hypothetical protein SprV_0902685200 [Sparganum proliferum]